jgi:hypothetical protein
MYSVLHPDFVYTDISDEIADHDLNYDAEEWNYNGKDVYRGLLDTSYKWNVYWLYDETLKRIGLAEHDPENPEIFYSLWFYSNPFSTLLQEPDWVSKKETIWSKISEEAYEDCLEDELAVFIDKTLFSKQRLVTPEFITKMPDIYECEKCGKRTLSVPSICPAVKKLQYLSLENDLIFISNSFEIYQAPVDSKIWNFLSLDSQMQLHGACEQPELSSEEDRLHQLEA